MVTRAWFVISVPEAVPASTIKSKVTTAEAPRESWPSPVSGSGGVRSLELIGIPTASGELPPSGWPTGSPFSVSESATQVVFAGTASCSIVCVAMAAPLL